MGKKISTIAGDGQIILGLPTNPNTLSKKCLKARCDQVLIIKAFVKVQQVMRHGWFIRSQNWIMKDVTHGDDDYIIIIAAGVNVLKGFFVIKVTKSDDVPDDVVIQKL
ncbi:hypothetical protein Tco_1217597 [Tanacetum coccineum]